MLKLTTDQSHNHGIMSKPTFRDRLRYKSDQFFQSGFTLQLFISSIIVVAVIALFFVVVEVFQINPGPDYGTNPSSDEGPYWPSVRLWWVITHILETYWLETGTFSQVLATMLTLFNFLVFAAIIGLVGSRIQQRLEQLKRGTSRVVEDGHIIILGWSGKVVPIIRELQTGLENRKQVYVLFTERPIDDIEQMLRKNFRRRGSPRWVIRQGSMTEMKDLELLSVERAKSVIILQRNDGQDRGDAQVVKSIMATAHIIEHGKTHTHVQPRIIAEIEHPSMVQLARAAAGNAAVSIVEPLEQLSKIILQTARQEGLVDVYDEILTHSRNELHLTPADRAEGLSWEETVFSFPKAIPIGLFRDGKPLLAPGVSSPPLAVRRGDSIIALARNEDDMRLSVPNVPEAASVPTASQDGDPTVIRHILILGWNEKVYPLLKEYSGYARAVREEFSVTIVSPSIPQHLDADEIMKSTGLGRELQLRIAHDDYLRPETYESFETDHYDALVVLGDHFRSEQIEDPDTRVIMTLLLLRALRGQPAATAKRQQIVGEILDVSNKELAESTGSVRDVIISNNLVSRIIAQISREPRIESVMRDLIDEEGMEIYFKPSSLYVESGTDVSFDQLLLASLRRGEVAMGYSRKEDESAPRIITLNPERTERLRIDEHLELIVLSETELHDH